MDNHEFFVNVVRTRTEDIINITEKYLDNLYTFKKIIDGVKFGEVSPDSASSFIAMHLAMLPLNLCSNAMGDVLRNAFDPKLLEEKAKTSM